MKNSKVIPARMDEASIEKMSQYRCIHGHTGKSHPSCYIKENGIQERKGAFDIEAGALDADFDICLSWSLKTIGKNEYWYDHVTKEDLASGKFDARIIGTLVESMWKYDRLIVHYGKNRYFDIPFVRARYLWLKARGVYDGPNFPVHGEMYVSDTYSMARSLLKISSRRQDNIAYVVQGKDIKTRIDKEHWMAIKHGNAKARKKAIDYIVEHNLRDVEQLEGNYLALLPFVNEIRTSI